MDFHGIDINILLQMWWLVLTAHCRSPVVVRHPIFWSRIVEADDPARRQKLRPSIVSFAGTGARLVAVEVKQIDRACPVSRYFGRASLMDLHARIDTGIPDVPFEQAA